MGLIGSLLMLLVTGVVFGAGFWWVQKYVGRKGA